MFVSIEQIELSLKRLEQVHPFFGMSFLILTRAQVPVGSTIELVLARAATELLDTYYKASASFLGHYSPFRTSNPSDRWIKPGYYKGALQRITTDTFADVTLHPKSKTRKSGPALWGWKSDYVKGLKRHLGSTLLPAFDLAVWLFRNHPWSPSVRPEELIARLMVEFRISEELASALFDGSVPDLATPWVRNLPVTERQLLRVIGNPPGAAPEEGAALESLALRSAGPADHLDYAPADRLNIITGDNSLGKTFLLECAWWALTGEWLDRPAFPKAGAEERKASISFAIKTANGNTQRHTSKFDWKQRGWTVPKDRQVLAGLVIYARHDGSFAVWDPAKLRLAKTSPTETKPSVLLDKMKLWDGLSVKSPLGGDEWVCNGLMRDWVQWQVGGERYRDQFEALTACLEALSPSSEEPLRPGEPRRWFPMDAREAPTLQMPYGPIPVQLASAGVQRVIGIAYILVWAWFEHLARSAAMHAPPQRRLVFLIDEAEAHLHPRWQRVIVPALNRVIGILSNEITPQIHLATHSAMVMASTETLFDSTHDRLHHLQLSGRNVTMEELPYVKRGTVDQWLLSDVFALRQARSVPGEEAIEAAKALQEQSKPDEESVRAVNQRLIEALAPDDKFWPRWRYFAEQHGVEE